MNHFVPDILFVANLTTVPTMCANLAMNPKSIIYPVTFSLFIVLFVGCLAMSQTVANRMSPARTKEAKRLFKQRCSKCHGQDGAGNTYGQIVGATNLTNPEWQERVDDKRVLNSIKHGRGQMPAFGEKLTDEQITSLASYVRTLGK